MPIWKLNEKNVLIIKKLLKKGNLFHKEIANIFNVSKGAIADISANRTWSYI